MITPRQTRLHRVRDLRSFQETIVDLACHGDVAEVHSCAVIVPSRAAATELRRTIENKLLLNDDELARRAVVFPDLLTRDDWYGQLHERLLQAPRRLSDLEREVIMRAACRDATDQAGTPPFNLRPALVIEMLRLYDELRSRQQTLDHFERLLVGELESQAEIDRGARRMLQQTRFLAAAWRAYEARVAASGGIDEHRLRMLATESACLRPYHHVVVSVGDRVHAGDGLWPADFDLLTRLPSLRRIDVIATGRELDAGLQERLHQLLPGMEDIQVEPGTDGRWRPSLVAPSSDRFVFVSRDREDEMIRVARRVKGEARKSDDRSRGLDATAVVFKRPLPYLYLARHVFEKAAIPYQTLSALPLASEPYAAVIDLVFSCVSSGFTRATLVALLGSPHLRFFGHGTTVDALGVSGLSRDLAGLGYLGDPTFLIGLPGHPDISLEAAAAAEAAADLTRVLSPLTAPTPASRHLSVLVQFLRAHDNPPDRNDSTGDRLLRARAAILGGLESLAAACERHDDPMSTIEEISATVRRWIERQTLAPDRNGSGLRLIDDRAARYADLDEIQLVGLVQGEWPDQPPRNVFYSPFLLEKLGWPQDVDWISGARAAFQDLLELPCKYLSVSTFTLEQDTLVEPSSFIDEVAQLVPLRVVESERPGRVFADEALSELPIVPDVRPGEPAAWARLRLSRTAASDATFHGQGRSFLPAAHSVAAVETYVSCPFRYFASQVVKLQEEIEDEPVMSGKSRGQFLHELCSTFYEDWCRRGGTSITAERMDEARSLFYDVMENALARLSPSEAAMERTRLTGSAAAAGLIDVLLRIEAERPGDVVDRLLEYGVPGEYDMANGEVTTRVAVRGRVDRIDLMADGTFRLFDYKSGRAPDRSTALQLPIYALCATERLKGHRGRDWTLGEAAYIAFRDPQPVQSMIPRDGKADAVLAEAQREFLGAVEGIGRGEFPPRPLNPFRCSFCPYSGVCRKDYVGDE